MMQVRGLGGVWEQRTHLIICACFPASPRVWLEDIQPGVCGGQRGSCSCLRRPSSPTCGRCCSQVLVNSSSFVLPFISCHKTHTD